MNAASKLEVEVGRGVADYINRRGGQIYVWFEPAGPAFDRVRATTEPPEGVEFQLARHVTEFRLHIHRRQKPLGPIRLVRPWWGLGKGIEVHTGAA
jgi:hypothetical protein